MLSIPKSASLRQPLKPLQLRIIFSASAVEVAYEASVDASSPPFQTPEIFQSGIWVAGSGARHPADRNAGYPRSGTLSPNSITSCLGYCRRPTSGLRDLGVLSGLQRQDFAANSAKGKWEVRPCETVGGACIPTCHLPALSPVLSYRSHVHGEH